MARTARVALAALVVLMTMALAGTASAKPRQASGLHDARYCEFFVVRGALPDVTVTVWNTIKLNNCPADQWNAVDPGALATELGATAVLLNGPRHFLMDSATAATGPVRSFDGIRARRVATIPIKTAADLARAPYSERLIERTNTWTWKRGRTVYELIAPCGARYLMQSYSQIVDPDLRIGELESLAGRLALPPGWRFRSRRLRNPLTLTTRDRARIIQDDLLNTYQREPAITGPNPPARHRVALTGVTRSVGAPSPGTIEDRGTISGDPFGTGMIDLLATFNGPQVTGPFSIDSPRGTANGRLWMNYTISGSEITFDGVACFAGGTGAFKGIRGTGLKAHDHNTLDGQNGTVSLDGFVTY
jgi:hypothetical protein